MRRPENSTEALTKALHAMADRPFTFMEVCGTHTVSIFRQGLRSLFPEQLKLISGPGCPVCVTSQGEIDAALGLAARDGVILATYGDMLRVPGSNGSLQEMRSTGADVRVVTSAAEAMKIAMENPERETVFLGVGFETTAPATAVVLNQAMKSETRNFSVLCLHKAVPPALRALACDPELGIDGFLLPGHVSVILGVEPYRFLADELHIACSIAGFEAKDILLGLVDLVRQVRSGTPVVRSLYPRAVRPEGNPLARQSMNRVFCSVDREWRGLGVIPLSGFGLEGEWSRFDALQRFGIALTHTPPPPGCACGDILRGRLDPPECPLFGKTCTPASPVGPCMVSGEGSCAAWYRYSKGGNDKCKI